MKKYIQYVNEFQDNNKFGLYFIENQLEKHLETNEENQTEIEHILDYLYSTKKKFKIGYKTIKEKADKWSKKLQETKIKDDEKENKDYKIIKKWKGFKMVKLVSEKSYKLEGKRMSHCVASYYGKDDEIYSLRDSKNNPHATLSRSSQQIKGKGNGKINPKYIKYVVEFLEELGIKVRDSEMENLGYVNFEEHKDECNKKDLFRNKYFYKENFNKLKNKNQLKFWNIFGLIKINYDFSFSLNFCVQECISNLKTIIKNSSTNAGGYSSTNAGGYCSTNAGGDYSTNAGRYSSTNAGRDYSTNAGGYSSINAGRDYSTNAGGYSSTNAGRYSSTNAGGDSSTNAGGNSSTNAGGKSSTNAGGNCSTNAGGNCSTNAGGNCSTNILNGKNAIGIGNLNSKCKGVIGSAFALPVYDEAKQNIINMIAVVIDGKKIKENTFYCVKNGKLVEWYNGIFDN